MNGLLKWEKASYLLTRYLWKDASEEHRTAAAHLMEKYIGIKYNRFFIPNEGAFSYYPGVRHATLDGTSGGIGVFFELGAFSAERQRRLWGGPEKTCADLGQCAVARLTERDFAPIMDLAERQLRSILPPRAGSSGLRGWCSGRILSATDARAGCRGTRAPGEEVAGNNFPEHGELGFQGGAVRQVAENRNRAGSRFEGGDPACATEPGLEGEPDAHCDRIRCPPGAEVQNHVSLGMILIENVKGS